MQEAIDTLEVQAVGSGGGAFAVGGDQLGDTAFIEAAAQASRCFALGLEARIGLVRATVWQSRRSAACAECE